MRLGVISDTHGLLRPEALAALRGVDYILHAGDVGDSGILDQLRQLAPVTAIRGNIDRTGPCSKLPDSARIELAGRSLYMLHSVNDLKFDAAALGISAVISGHSHKPSIDRRDGVLYFNPGSAGPRRFKLPVTVGFLSLSAGRMQARIVHLL